LLAGNFLMVGSEHVAVEGDPSAELSARANQMFDSLPMPAAPKKKEMTGREECEMLEKAFTIPTPLAAAGCLRRRRRMPKLWYFNHKQVA
jgi:hypothetical protein